MDERLNKEQSARAYRRQLSTQWGRARAKLGDGQTETTELVNKTFKIPVELADAYAQDETTEPDSTFELLIELADAYTRDEATEQDHDNFKRLAELVEDYAQDETAEPISDAFKLAVQLGKACAKIQMDHDQIEAMKTEKMPADCNMKLVEAENAELKAKLAETEWALKRALGVDE